MPDDPTPPESAPDVRDERMAELLAVAPLDEVTRRRLVQGALAESARKPSRFANIAAVAAAIAIGAGIGAILVNSPDEPPVRETAAPTEAAAPADGSSSTFAAAPVTAPINALGALGDVSTEARLRDAVTRATERRRDVAADSLQGAELRSAASYPCVERPADQIGLVAIIAAGTGSYQQEAVTVVIGTSPVGDSLAVVLGPPPDCAVLTSVSLPQG